MKKQRNFISRIKFHCSILLLLAVVLAMSGMSGIAMAAAGDVWVDNGGGATAGDAIFSGVNIVTTGSTTTIGTTSIFDSLNISSGTYTGNLNMNSVENVNINVNKDGISTGESFKVNVGGSGGAGVPTTITTIQSNEIGTTINTTAGSTASTTIGSATSATNVGGTLGVTGITTTNGINNGGDGITNAGAISGATTVTATTFNGALTGNVTGNVSGSAATVTGAVQTAITSVGTLTSLDVNGQANIDNTTGTISNYFVVGSGIAGGGNGIMSLSQDSSTGTFGATIATGKAVMSVLAESSDGAANSIIYQGDFMGDGSGNKYSAGIVSVDNAAGAMYGLITDASAKNVSVGTLDINTGAFNGLSVTDTAATLSNNAGSGSNNGIVGIGNALGDGNIRTVVGNINYDKSIMTGLEANANHVTVGTSDLSGNFITGLSSNSDGVMVGAVGAGGQYGLSADTSGNVAIQGITTTLSGGTTAPTTLTLNNTGASFDNNLSMGGHDITDVHNLTTTGDVHVGGTLWAGAIGATGTSLDISNEIGATSNRLLVDTNHIEAYSGSAGLALGTINTPTGPQPGAYIGYQNGTTQYGLMADDSSVNVGYIDLTNPLAPVAHGLQVTSTQTTLSGGTNSSHLTLADSAATLSVGTAPEIQVIQATNTAGVTAVNIGGTSNVLNNIMAMYADGVNNLTANATTGTNNISAHTNNIEGAHNNMGVATPGSVNTIGNAGTSVNTITGATNTITGTTSTIITGGSSVLTMDNTGASFSGSSGGPVQMHGIDDGTSPYDAVNVQQLGAGLAMVAGLAALPQVDQGKTFAIGVGTGGYQSQVSLAGGVSARFLGNFVFKAGGAFIPGYSGKTDPVWNAALQYSF